MNPLQENAQFYQIVVICVDETRDVSLLHALAPELDHRPTIVCFHTNGFRLHSAPLVRRAHMHGQCPVPTHRGVVHVHAQMLALPRPDGQPVRAPLPPLVLELLNLTDQPHVSAYDLPVEVPERDVEHTRPLLHTVAPVPQRLLLFDRVDHRLCLAHFYND